MSSPLYSGLFALLLFLILVVADALNAGNFTFALLTISFCLIYLNWPIIAMHKLKSDDTIQYVFLILIINFSILYLIIQSIFNIFWINDILYSVLIISGISGFIFCIWRVSELISNFDGRAKFFPTLGMFIMIVYLPISFYWVNNFWRRRLQVVG